MAKPPKNLRMLDMSRCDHARLLVRALCQGEDIVGAEEEVVLTDGKDFKEGKERMKKVKERIKWTQTMDARRANQRSRRERLFARDEGQHKGHD